MSFTLSLEKVACERDERVLFEYVTERYCSGDIVQLLGPNGSGKTTLAKVIVGIVPHAQGAIRWTHSRVKNCPSLRDSLLYFGHNPAVKSSLTAYENLTWYFGLNGSKQLTASTNTENSNTESVNAESVNAESEITRAQLVDALAKVGLAGYEDVLCYQMSAGQQRRVALARLYLSQAPLWILDEPFTAIDKKGVAALEQRIIEHASAGGLVLLTTHQALSIEPIKQLDIAHYAPVRSARRYYD